MEPQDSKPAEFQMPAEPVKKQLPSAGVSIALVLLLATVPAINIWAGLTHSGQFVGISYILSPMTAIIAAMLVAHGFKMKKPYLAAFLLTVLFTIANVCISFAGCLLTLK